MATAAPLQAGFEGHPWAENPDCQTWQAAYSNYNPIGQVFTALQERVQVVKGWSQLSIVQSWTVDDGMETNVVTVGSYDYTNVTIRTKTAWTTNAIPGERYTYDLTDGGTGAGVAHLTHYFLNRLDKYLMEVIGQDPVDTTFLATNQAVGGTFDAWFAQTDDDGNHPSDFPYVSLPYLFDLLDIGHATNLVEDPFGVITNGDAFFILAPWATSHYPLVEAAYTGTEWQTNNLGKFNRRYYGTELPRILYVPAVSGEYSSVSVTLTGDALVITSAYHWLAQDLTNTTETVSVIGQETALTEPWYQITNVTVTGTGATGDVLHVGWAAPMELHAHEYWMLTSGAGWSHWFYLAALDERAAVLRELQWVTGGYADVPETSDNARYWYGFTNSWGGAKTEAEAYSEPAHTQTLNHVRIYTSGSVEETNWYHATAWAFSDYLTVDGVSTMLPHEVDFYLRSHAGDGGEHESTFDDAGLGLTMSTYVHVASAPLTNAAAVTSDTQFGALTIPTWCDTPTTNAAKSRGFYAVPFGDLRCLIRWDVEGGFTY